MYNSNNKPTFLSFFCSQNMCLPDTYEYIPIEQPFSLWEEEKKDEASLIIICAGEERQFCCVRSFVHIRKIKQ